MPDDPALRRQLAEYLQMASGLTRHLTSMLQGRQVRILTDLRHQSRSLKGTLQIVNQFVDIQGGGYLTLRDFPLLVVGLNQIEFIHPDERSSATPVLNQRRRQS